MTRNYPDFITSYLDYTENSEPPRLFREWASVAIIAACLQRKCYLEWSGDVFPNFYIVLTSPAGKVRKGTALAPAYNMLLQIGLSNIVPDSITREALIRFIAEKQTVIERSNGTLFTHCSVTIFSQELTVFLGHKNNQLITDLTDLYDNRSPMWRYLTKHQGSDEIVGAWVNLIGATTPGAIHESLPTRALSGGLLSRMIFVYEERKGKSVPDPRKTDKERQMEELLAQDLESILALSGEFKLTQDFVDAWAPWYMQQEDNPPFQDERFEGYFSRRPVQALKLSMVLSASGNSNMLIDSKILKRAINLLERTEFRMRFAFGGFGILDHKLIIEAIRDELIIRGEMSWKDILSRMYNIADAETVARAIGAMVDYGWCRKETRSSSNKSESIIQWIKH